jgi:hypothetical protein
MLLHGWYAVMNEVTGSRVLCCSAVGGGQSVPHIGWRSRLSLVMMVVCVCGLEILGLRVS